MDWDDARYFLAIAREGQMLGAAKRLNVSQARLSRRLQSLENTLGVRLFDRSTRGCALTDDGKTFLEAAQGMEAEALGALARLRQQREQVEGDVRIGAPDGFGSAFLAPRIGALSQNYPGLRIQLAPLARNFSLSEREADIAVMVGRPTKGRLRGKKLTDYSLGLYAAQGYLEKHGAPKTQEECAAHRRVGYVEDLLPTPELIFNEEFGLNWRADIEVSTAIGQLAAVRAGAGIGVLHDFIAVDYPELQRLLPQTRAVRSYWAMWHENLNASQRVAVVAEFLERTVRKERSRFLLE